MTLEFTAEQDALRDAVRRLLAARSSEAEVRRLAATESGWDERTWRDLAGLGALGMGVPDELGGSGGSFVELAIVLEEAGAALLPAPLFSTALLASSLILQAGDDDARRDYLPRIAAGDLTATVCLPPRDAAPTVIARDTEGGVTLSGTCPAVIDGGSVDLLLVVAGTDAGPAVFAVEAGAAGVRRTPLVTLDLVRKQARIDLDSATARLLARPATASAALERLGDLAAAGLAMEQVGGMQRLLAMAVGYAQQRVQFGRVIGSFQAIKHRCADMLTKLELARAAAYQAVWAAAEAPDQLPLAASLAKSYCSDAYYEVARANILVHGGIGFTWEHPAHLYYRRAKSDQSLFGLPAEHRERLLRLQGV